LLAPVYGWFTEGFDTKDLLDAKALLAELASLATAQAESPSPARAAARLGVREVRIPPTSAQPFPPQADPCTKLADAGSSICNGKI
jgi:hypothetical protein